MSTAEYPWPQPEADPTPPPPIPAAAPARGLNLKNPRLAAGLSLFPGMGNVYNGLYMRGLIFFLIVGSLITIIGDNGNPLFGLGIAFFWLFNIIDAYRQATLINYGYAQDLGLVDLPKHPKASQGGLAAGVILTLIGLFAFLDRYFNIDLDWLFDLWPLALIGIGVWLIVGSIRERRKRAGGIPEI